MAVQELLAGHHVLPTDYGKSMIITMFLLVTEEIRRPSAMQGNHSPSSVIISPLRSSMEDQITEIRSWDVWQWNLAAIT